MVSKLGSRAAPPLFYAAWHQTYRWCSPPNRAVEIAVALAGWLPLDRSAGWRVFAETIVNSIFVMVVHVIANQPT